MKKTPASRIAVVKLVIDVSLDPDELGCLVITSKLLGKHPLFVSIYKSS